MWWYAGIVIIIAVLAALYLHRHQRHQHHLAWLRVHGAARCHAAIPALWAAAKTPDLIPDFWERAELPLVEAVPDCAPCDKAAFIAACDALAQATRHRDVARRIMTLRNSL